MNLETDSPFPTPEQLFHFGIRRPLAALRQSIREGGPIQQWITRRGRHAMRRAALTLSPIPVREPTGTEPAIALMTGANFWEQTVFCLHTLLRHSPPPPLPVFLVDDGTLGEHATTFTSRFPGIRIFSTSEVRTVLETNLPTGEFPSLRGHRRAYKHLRKLTDIHCVRPGWNLVLDSDMLFFRRPDTVLNWLSAPARPLVMTDSTESYGYPRDVLETMAGAPLPPRINVGITGLDITALPWRLFETWTASLLLQYGSSYYLEQALLAMLLAHIPHQQLPAEDYVVLPRPPESTACSAILHHYVAGSKAFYFRRNWRRALAATPTLP
ncbi:hypothetical protein [Geminisphaera colitermitum]|uniref:hypothetical protein n=1 Tax=Geminisphaera colitermitum TaxID=1148786 RepID=UPI000158D26A|nr:hypothetical protein [Geminisphaera colitermitum]